MSNQQQLSASVRNRQRAFTAAAAQIEPEHPLFRRGHTAKLFPALAAVKDDEVAGMFGLPPVDRRLQKEQWLVDRSDPFRDRASVFHRAGNARGESPTHSGAAGAPATHAELLLRERTRRPFVVTRHGASTAALYISAQPTHASADEASADRREAQRARDAELQAQRANRGAFVVRSAASGSRELQCAEYLNAVDDDTMAVLQAYMFSGRAAVDAAARKRDDIVSMRTTRRRQKGIRDMKEQQRFQQIQERSHQSGQLVPLRRQSPQRN